MNPKLKPRTFNNTYCSFECPYFKISYNKEAYCTKINKFLDFYNSYFVECKCKND